MKELALKDLSRDELLAWIEVAVLPRFLPGAIVRQTDLLSVRHASLEAQLEVLSLQRSEAYAAELRAWKAYIDWRGSARQRHRLDGVYLDLKAKRERIERAVEKARTAERTCWVALDAEWSRGR